MTTSTHKTFADLVSFIESNARTAWRPQFSSQSEDIDPTASKYGGYPWLPNEMSWPVSESGEPLNFVMQLNGSAPGLPEEYAGHLILVFVIDYADSESQKAWVANPRGENNEAFSVLLVPLGSTGALRKPQGHASQAPAQVIDKWEQFVDHPSPFNLQAMVENEVAFPAPLDGGSVEDLLMQGYGDLLGGPPVFQSHIDEQEWADWSENFDEIADEDFELEDARELKARTKAITNEAHGKIGGWGCTGPSGAQPKIVATTTPLYQLSWEDDPRLDRSIIHRGVGILVHREDRPVPDFIYSW